MNNISENEIETCATCGKEIKYRDATEQELLNNWLFRITKSKKIKIIHVDCIKIQEDADKIARDKKHKEDQIDYFLDKIYQASRYLHKDFLFKTFESYQAKPDDIKKIEFLKGFYSSEISGVTISGNTGSGKTHLALAILCAEILKIIKEENYDKYRYAFRFVTSSEFARQSKINTFDKTQFYFKDLEESDLLIFDDLGSESVTEFTKENIFSLLDYRVNKKLKTIVTTNLTMNEIKNKYHERVSSRLKEFGPFVEIKNSDYRENILKNNLTNFKNNKNQNEKSND